MSNEVWKIIENGIRISNYGKVILPSYKGNNGRLYTEKTEKDFYNDGDGYLSFQYKKILYKVHKTIAIHFIQEDLSGVVVHHKDEDKENNSVDNLEIMLPNEHNSYHSSKAVMSEESNRIRSIKSGGENNAMHGKLNGTHPACKSVKQYDLDGNFIKEFPSYTEAGKSIGVTPQSIYGGVKGGSKQSGGFLWK